MRVALSTTLLTLSLLCLTGCPPEKPSAVDSRELQVGDGAAQEEAAGQVVVARVHGEEISLEEFERRIDGLAPFARVRLQSTERRKEYLQTMAQFEVMADEGERRGLGDQPEVGHGFKETLAKLLLAEELRGAVRLEDLDEAAVEAFFWERRASYGREERRRVARIWTAEEATAQSVRERWEGEFGEEEDLDRRQRHFQRYAFERSEDRLTGDLGGDLGWESERAAFTVESGALQGPEPRDEGWELWMVVEVEEALDPELDEVESRVRNDLYEELRERARRSFIEELLAAAEIERREERLPGVTPPGAAAPPRLEELPRVPLQTARP